MRLSVLHETEYRYEAPVLLSRQYLHLTPRVLPWQKTLAHRIAVEPRPDETLPQDDYFGNATNHIQIAASHNALIVRAASTVEVNPRADAAERRATPAWERLRDELRAGKGVQQLEPFEFLYASPHIEMRRELAEFSASSFPAGRSVFAGARALTKRINRDFRFDPRATTVATPLVEVLKLRRGVCQDFAHLMIGCLRSLGIPARYVSGYILTTPPPGKPRMVGADASHAWVSVWCGPEAGWIDFDPTNDCVVDDEHITLGWGRDFADVTPMRGVILGGGEQTLDVRVTVAPL